MSGSCYDVTNNTSTIASLETHNGAMLPIVICAKISKPKLCGPSILPLQIIDQPLLPRFFLLQLLKFGANGQKALLLLSIQSCRFLSLFSIFEITSGHGSIRLMSALHGSDGTSRYCEQLSFFSRWAAVVFSLLSVA